MGAFKFRKLDNHDCRQMVVPASDTEIIDTPASELIWADSQEELISKLKQKFKSPPNTTRVVSETSPLWGLRNCNTSTFNYDKETVTVYVSVSYTHLTLPTN